MNEMADPMKALRSIQKIIRFGRIDLDMRPGGIHKDITMHFDSPNGESRFSYFDIDGSIVKAVSIFAPAEPYKGVPCFGVGYAVDQSNRKRGLGKRIVRYGIDELTNGLVINGVNEFYLEAVVGIGNAASQGVAKAVLGDPVEESIDGHSGKKAIVYRKLIVAR